MKEFTYIIKDKDGIHARPAGMIVKEASVSSSKITITKGDKTADAKRIFAIMSLAAKAGDEIKVTIDGSDEDKTFEAMEKLFNENL